MSTRLDYSRLTLMDALDLATLIEVEAARRYAQFAEPVSYTHLRAHETVLDLVCRLLLEKKNNETQPHIIS